MNGKRAATFPPTPASHPCRKSFFSSTRIEAELLVRQADGHWPKRPLVLKKGDLLALPSISFESPVEAFYARTTIKE